MTESDFWPLLERRLCREFAGLRDNHLRALWCDGFLHPFFQTAPPGPRITGHAWIGREPRVMEEWDFTLLLPPQTQTADDIDWPTLLPAADVTGWLAIDVPRKTLRITPAAAYPDRPHP